MSYTPKVSITLTKLNEAIYTAVSRVSPQAAAIIAGEAKLRREHLPFIASENFMSPAVSAAMAYAPLAARNMESSEPGVSFYQGEKYAQEAQKYAIDQATKLFKCKFANVQPFSGSIANAAILMALLTDENGKLKQHAPVENLNGGTELTGKPIVLSMRMSEGGHFTHGASYNISGMMADVVNYGVHNGSGPKTGTINYEELEEKAYKYKPDVIICGGSAYARTIDWERVARIAHEVGAKLVADVSHYAGLIAGNRTKKELEEYRAEREFGYKGSEKEELYPNPLQHGADVMMTTTHKSLRGPRGAVILWNDDALTKKINSAVFPGIQGEPAPNMILAKGVAFEEAQRPAYRQYAEQILLNAKALENVLKENGFNLVGGGTDTHMVTIDLSGMSITGQKAAEALERTGVIANKMPIPNDPLASGECTGLRLGVPCATTMGLDENDMLNIGKRIAKTLQSLAQRVPLSEDIEKQNRDLCERAYFEQIVGAMSPETGRAA